MQRKQTDTQSIKVKVVFLGDKGVGKSSIINRFSLGKFEENTPPTIGVDFMTKHCKYNHFKYKLELWDTAGQQKYRSLIKGYLRNANTCVFVYDESRPQTYANLVDWIKAFEEVPQSTSTFSLIFGNKTDIVEEKKELLRVINKTQKEHPSLSNMFHLSGSAKDGKNVNNIFEQVLENCEQGQDDKIKSSKTIGSRLIRVIKGEERMQEGSTCCK